MREIKFRGKSKSGYWYYGFLTIDSYKNYFIESHSGTMLYSNNIIPQTVGQFTGLKDKNGKDIYEGDIIKHGESIRFIEYKWTNYVATRIDNTETILLSFCKNVEIIGNIHDNPELLNK